MRERLMRERFRMEQEESKFKQGPMESRGGGHEDQFFKKRITDQRGFEKDCQKPGDFRREQGPGKFLSQAREESYSGTQHINHGERNFGGDNFGGGYKPKDLGLCFRCGKEGHHQATCTNDPFCYKCRQTGHMAYKCTESLEGSLNLRGYGFRG